MLIGYARISKADGSQSLDLQRGHSQRFDAWNLGFVCILYLGVCTLAQLLFFA